MSITDELREWVKSLYTPNSGELKLQAERIADRIDAEHEKVLDERKAEHGQMWLKGYSECHAELMEDNETLASDLERCGWIRLPLDADGVPIRAGDKMCQIRRDGTLADPFEVAGYELVAGELWPIEKSVGYKNNVNPRYLRHYHEPTVEDVLREFASDIADVLGGDDFRLDGSDELFAEYAAKLRLAGDGE